jgi:PAS domain S-box-containing protein
VGGKPPFGIFGLNTTQAERDWPDALVKRLQLVAQIFANALARKRADQALRESEERMTLAAQATGVGVWMWNIPSNEVWGSERWLVLFGFAPDTAVTFEKVIQRIHPDDRKMVEDGVRRALADWSDYLGDFRVVLPDGTERWIVSRGRIYQDSHGKPARMVGTAIDITHRKQTELALVESELRYRTLFETAPEGILLIGTDGRVRAANPAQARLYGYESPQQLEGLYAPLFVAEKDREQAARNMKDLLNGEERPARDYTALRRDGSEFMVEVTSAILRGPGRELQGYLCLTRDITESKRSEEALRDLSGRLISAYEEERARLARELHDDVTQRLARLAIDAGRVERGANEVSPAETMRSVRDGLVSLSEDVHALSYRLHPAVLEDLGLVEALKAECERFSRQEAVSTDVTLKELPAVLPPGAALCLFRVTQEALRNVARHARARTVKVSVRTLDGGLQLAVRDDGAGYDPGLQRERPSLGLASMRERVRLLAGELDIESAPGQGTTILVWVPLKKGQS